MIPCPPKVVKCFLSERLNHINDNSSYVCVFVCMCVLLYLRNDVKTLASFLNISPCHNNSLGLLEAAPRNLRPGVLSQHGLARSAFSAGLLFQLLSGADSCFLSPVRFSGLSITLQLYSLGGASRAHPATVRKSHLEMKDFSIYSRSE